MTIGIPMKPTRNVHQKYFLLVYPFSFAISSNSFAAKYATVIPTIAAIKITASIDVIFPFFFVDLGISFKVFGLHPKSSIYF